MSRRTIGELRTYVSVPKQPYFIVEVPGEDALTSEHIHVFFREQALASIQNTAFDIGQVLMRSAFEKSISSLRNLVKATVERYRHRAAMLFLLPDLIDESENDDEVLQLVVAILQDSDGDHSGSELVAQTSRDKMSALAHGEYILVAYDALMSDLVDELLLIFVGLLDRHDADESVRPVLQEVVHQYRASLRAYLRRFGVWV